MFCGVLHTTRFHVGTAVGIFLVGAFLIGRPCNSHASISFSSNTIPSLLSLPRLPISHQPLFLKKTVFMALPKGAIRWAHDNASRYGGNGGDLVVVGHSAGAHLAALCLADGRWLEEAGVVASPASLRVEAARGASAAGGGDGAGAGAPSRGPPPPSSCSAPAPLPVSGFVGISGVYDIPRMAGNVVGGVLARAAFGNDRRTWQRVSPVHCIRAIAACSSSGGGGGSSSARDPAAGVVERSGGARAPATTVGTANSGSFCPLLRTETLLLTAGTDFHLEDDAEALAEALEHARHNSLSQDGGDAGKLVEGSVGEGPVGQRREAGGAAAGTGESAGDESRSAGGSVRHVRLDGEDHLSVMVSFGEPDTQVSKAVMDFILGIRKPR